MMRRLILALVSCVAFAPGAYAQQRPLVTEDPETVGQNRLLVETGVDYVHDALFTVSGLQGNLLRAPTLGFSLGVGPAAEIQVDGGLFSRLSIAHRRAAPLAHLVDATGDRTSDIDDVWVGAKVRLFGEGTRRPSMGLRFATRLPNASNESGLGLDTTDFYQSLLIAKTVQSVRVVGNFGFAILGVPTQGNIQNDVVTYGLSFARALTPAAEVVGEVNGRWDTRNGEPPPGTENRGTVRFGGRYTRGMLRADAAVLLGTTSADSGLGFTVGATYVFSLPQVP